MRRLAPYAVAIGGVTGITGAIALIASLAAVPGLSVLYLLLVLWLGARWGRGPAVAGSFAAFLLYDFFFVPPVGTFSVRGPGELLELVVLLAVALVTSQLAGSLRRTQARAESLAGESRALYELAAAGLRSSDTSEVLLMLSLRATELRGVGRFALRGVGIAVRGGSVKPVRTHPGATEPAYLPLGSGVAVIGIDAAEAEPDGLRMLAALIGLADLLLDRRRAALEAERARGLESSDRLKTAILSSLSHELKSPIASLRTGLTALAAPQAGLQADQRELLVDLDGQTTRLDRMVGDLLALSRLEAGLPLDKGPYDFADLVAGATRQLRAELAANQLVIELAEDLPPVEVDEVQAGRVLANLLENAHEWAPPGGVIEVGAAPQGAMLEAWVENEGPAIAAADLDHVFDTFWTRRARGSGLGLAICKRVVEAHEGTIRVEIRRRGPRFIFTFPLANVPAVPVS